jgi:hypothetical protein
VLAAFGMKDMVNLRIVAICSNVAFITYAVMLNLPPILILHVILLPLNGWRLAQELQNRRMIQHTDLCPRPGIVNRLIQYAAKLLTCDEARRQPHELGMSAGEREGRLPVSRARSERNRGVVA